MRKRLYKIGWGGRGEHGFRFIDYEVKDSYLTIYLISEDYSDWGGTSHKYNDQENSKSFRIDEKIITKEFLLECIQITGKEFNDQYLLPETIEELDFTQKSRWVVTMKKIKSVLKILKIR